MSRPRTSLGRRWRGRDTKGRETGNGTWDPSGCSSHCEMHPNGLPLLTRFPLPVSRFPFPASVPLRPLEHVLNRRRKPHPALLLRNDLLPPGRGELLSSRPPPPC